jgi:hypothetical protein
MSGEVRTSDGEWEGLGRDRFIVDQGMVGDIPLKAGTKDTLLILIHIRPQGAGVDVELPFHA